MEIIPAILTRDAKELEAQIRAVEGRVSRVHIDIIDGEFAPDKTVEVEALFGIEVDVLFDAHLMVREPGDFVEKCIRSLVDRIIGQVEKMSDQFEFANKVQEIGHEAGLALDIDTQVSKLDRDVLSYIDLVLLMGHKAGAQGGELDESVFEKIKELQAVRAEVGGRFSICLDGGVNAGNIERIKQTGISEVAVGSGAEKLLK